MIPPLSDEEIAAYKGHAELAMHMNRTYSAVPRICDDLLQARALLGELLAAHDPKTRATVQQRVVVFLGRREKT